MTQSNLAFTDGHEIPKGYKKTEVGVIPNDWNVESLQNLCRSSITYGIVQCGPHIPNGIPYIRVSDMNSSELNVDEMLRTSPEIASSFGRSKVEEGDIVYALRGKLGEVKMVGTEVSGANLTQGTARIAPKNNIDNRYLLWTLRSPQALKQAVKEAKGSTFVEITLGNLKGIGVPLPSSREEQQKIATALSDTDVLISELEKLIEKKQAIKTATMQQLLTGKTRLPEFALREDGMPKGYKDSELGQIPEDWEVCKFEKLCKVFTKQTGFDYSAYIKPSLIKQYKRGHIPFVQNKDFEGKNFNFDTDYYIPKNIAEKFPNILLNEKCLLISISGSIGNVGLFNESSLAFIGGAIAIAKFIDPNKLDWVLYYMLSQQGQNTLLNNVKAGSHQNITLEDIRKFSIPLPSDMEQNLITSMLSNLDAEIKNLDFRLDKLKRIKLGMMQELLTGKTRLI